MLPDRLRLCFYLSSTIFLFLGNINSLFAQEQVSEPPESITSGGSENEPQKYAKNCAGAPVNTFYIDHALVGTWSRLGAAHIGYFVFCNPLFTHKPDSLMLKVTNVKYGLFVRTSPAWNLMGLYFSVRPLSLLRFRFELGHFSQWPVVDGVGALNVRDYDTQFEFDTDQGYVDAGLDRDSARAAQGFYFRAEITLFGELELTENLNFLFKNDFNIEYYYQQDVFNNGLEYYLNIPQDITLRFSDWVFVETLGFFLDGYVLDNLAIRGGIINDVRFVAETRETDYKAMYRTLIHIGIFSPKFRNPRFRDAQIFVQAGLWWNHPSRGINDPNQRSRAFTMAFGGVIRYLFRKPLEFNE